MDIDFEQELGTGLELGSLLVEVGIDFGRSSSFLSRQLSPYIVGIKFQNLLSLLQKHHPFLRDTPPQKGYEHNYFSRKLYGKNRPV